MGGGGDFLAHSCSGSLAGEVRESDPGQAEPRHVWPLEPAYDLCVRRLASIRLPDWAANPRLGGAIAVGVLVALTAGLAPVVDEDGIPALAMVFLLVVLLASAVWGYVVGIVSAVVADMLLNVFFVPPLHTVTVQDPLNVVALAVFLAVAVVGASMLALFRRQLRTAAARGAELSAMLEISRQLAEAATPRVALDVLVDAIARTVHAGRCDILYRDGGQWQTVASSGVSGAATRDELALANRAIETGQITRILAQDDRSTGSLSIRRRGARDTFVPFRSGGGEPGVVHLTGNLQAPGGGDVDALLRAFADEAGVALHRAGLAEQARRAEAIRKSDEFKSVLLSSVSHDLRSPLTAIKAAVGVLRSDNVEWSDNDREQLLETIESQTDRLTDTVSALLDMSRLEGGAIQPALEPVNVRAFLEDVALATSSATKGREVRIEAPPELWARADYGLLLRVVGNLIENAANYSTPGGKIFLTGETARGRTVISVADEGPGIPTEDLPHIFEKFYRGKTERKLPGTGLGLSIVRAMVELMGGRVTVESSPSGTVFGLSLVPGREPA